MKARVNHINRFESLTQNSGRWHPDPEKTFNRSFSHTTRFLSRLYYNTYYSRSGIQRSTISTKLLRSRDYRRIVHRLLSFDWKVGADKKEGGGNKVEKTRERIMYVNKKERRWRKRRRNKKKRGINKKIKKEEGNHRNRAIITIHGVNLN